MLIQNVSHKKHIYVTCSETFCLRKRIFVLTDKGLYIADINFSLLFYVQYPPCKDTVGCTLIAWILVPAASSKCSVL